VDALDAALIASAVLAFGLVSRRIEGSAMTPPLAFVALGMALAPDGLGLLDVEVGEGLAHLLTELTLVLVLFGDAARIDLPALRRELGLPVRLLALGLPLTILAGFGLAVWLLPELGLAHAALLAAILAPTDAALGQAVVSDSRVPLRVRQALNVESGLNDGLALPVVLILAALAGAGVDGGRSAVEWLGFAALQVTVGPTAGLAVGWLGARAVHAAAARGWMSDSFEQLSGLALALLAYAGAELAGGNGFIAAFTAGLTFGTVARGFCEGLYRFVEAEGQLLVLLVFLLIGCALAWPTVQEASAATWLYALGSLTVVRILPVAIALLGAGLQPVSLLFLGWFGPRGLASVLYALLVAGPHVMPEGSPIFSTVILTVLLSVLLHGVSAAPAARRYGAYLQARREHAPHEHRPVTEHPLRVRRRSQG
jgi:NhaP-type Na+/H+ or K+/H+ antiporter